MLGVIDYPVYYRIGNRNVILRIRVYAVIPAFCMVLSTEDHRLFDPCFYDLQQIESIIGSRIMKVTVIGEQISQEEIDAYIEHSKQKYADKVIKEITIQVDGEFVDLKCEFETVPFERVRRITGYLVGSLDRFNDGKRAEVEDRVKHSL